MFAYGLADATAVPKTLSSLASILPFWYRLTQIVLEKMLLNSFIRLQCFLKCFETDNSERERAIRSVKRVSIIHKESQLNNTGNVCAFLYVKGP